jgi:thiosulfate reductase cytochrome b subunit
MELKHLRAIRWFHWINFPLLAIMIWTGLWIYWANDVYRVGFGDFTLFHFFPDSFYSFFQMNNKLAQGMAWHFVFMWLFIVNGVLYVSYTVVSGEWRKLVPGRNALRDAVYVTLYDLHLRKVMPAQGKYNAAQQISYTAIVIMGLGSLVTGLAIWRYVQFSWLAALLGGYKAARIEHFLLTLGYVSFFVVHVGQVIRAGWNNARAMITGYQIVEARVETPERCANER